MAASYEEIVKKWYDKLRPEFIDLLMSKYRGSKMRLEDAENIYQDIFIAIHENLKEGRIDESKSWRSYVMRIGLNIASKQYRGIGLTEPITRPSGDEEDAYEISLEVQKKIDELSSADDSLYNNADAKDMINEELMHTPEPCASLIRDHYVNGMKDSEILEETERYSSVASIKVTRIRCMKELIKRVKLAFYNAGIIDKKPER